MLGIGLTWLFFQAKSTEACPGPETVTIGGIEMRAIYACTRLEQIQGLGGITEEEFAEKGDVMIFPMKQAEIQNFWMGGMQFPIDITWVENGEIVKIQENIPHPALTEEIERMSSSPFVADMVLEFRAGTVEEYNIEPGDKME